jgi:hypothetical protein
MMEPGGVRIRAGDDTGKPNRKRIIKDVENTPQRRKNSNRKGRILISIQDALDILPLQIHVAQPFYLGTKAPPFRWLSLA